MREYIVVSLTLFFVTVGGPSSIAAVATAANTKKPLCMSASTKFPYTFIQNDKRASIFKNAEGTVGLTVSCNQSVDTYDSLAGSSLRTLKVEKLTDNVIYFDVLSKAVASRTLMFKRENKTYQLNIIAKLENKSLLEVEARKALAVFGL
jgi:hypothetical protein